MRFPYATLVASLVLGLAAPALASAKNSAPSRSAGYDMLQGTWQLVSGERDGVPLSDAEVRTTILLAKGMTYELPVSSDIGTSQTGTYTVNVSQTPYTVDSTPTNGPQAGQAFLGIWKLEGDLQTIAFAPPGQPRPTEFRADAGSGDILQVWRQVSKQVIDPQVAIYFGDVVRAFNQRDAAKFAATWTEDGDLTDPFGVHSVGRPAIQASMQHMFSSYFPNSTATVKVDDVRLVGTDLALVDATWMLAAASGGFPSQSQAFYVLERQADGSWLALAARGYQSLAQH